jgi:hypothetical protein
MARVSITLSPLCPQQAVAQAVGHLTSSLQPPDRPSLNPRWGSAFASYMPHTCLSTAYCVPGPSPDCLVYLHEMSVRAKWPGLRFRVARPAPRLRSYIHVCACACRVAFQPSVCVPRGFSTQRVRDA